MLKVCRILATLLISGLLGTGVVFGDTVKPANVILFIGDGMDEHQITMARNYLLGPDEGLLAALPPAPERTSTNPLSCRPLANLDSSQDWSPPPA